MRNALRRIGLACLPVAFACSLFATNAPAPSNTNFIDPELTAENPQVKQLAEAMKKEGFKPESMLNAQFLFVSLLWGSVGGGYLIYARKQREIVPLLGGVAMIAVSFVVTSWFWMSVSCLALMAGVWQMRRLGD
ncbi:MAG: hypothetical protein NTZ16_05780 [Verrucomicrobia bacterium]|nr:hypothetical protein [Verrucomicrobiota bacterium]